jgi:hypothetical protein
MTSHRIAATCLVALLAPVATAHAQNDRKTPSVFVAEPGGTFKAIEALEATPFESISHVTGAPFSADAVTEFTQVLGDGNRIERRYHSSIARDNRGRTRREEEIVLLSPLGFAGSSPTLVTIVDPDARVSYTLDQRLRIAHRNQLAVTLLTKWTTAANARTPVAAPPAIAKRIETGPASDGVVTESLGRRSIEGVMADGTRTTSTIPAGAVGNLQPIEIVSERWFSPELQMPVLITRRDPRTGDTVYRLHSIVRAEPPDHLFTVPPDYEVRNGTLTMWRKLEASSLIQGF